MTKTKPKKPEPKVIFILRSEPPAADLAMLDALYQARRARREAKAPRTRS